MNLAFDSCIVDLTIFDGNYGHGGYSFVLCKNGDIDKPIFTAIIHTALIDLHVYVYGSPQKKQLKFLKTISNII